MSLKIFLSRCMQWLYYCEKDLGALLELQLPLEGHERDYVSLATTGLRK